MAAEQGSHGVPTKRLGAATGLHPSVAAPQEWNHSPLGPTIRAESPCVLGAAGVGPSRPVALDPARSGRPGLVTWRDEPPASALQRGHRQAPNGSYV